MNATAPISFARGAPSLDIIAVDDLREAADRAFQVVGRAQVRKSAFPASDVYGPSAHSVLVLITCGGPWLGRQRGYRDNILVYARSA